MVWAVPKANLDNMLTGLSAHHHCLDVLGCNSSVADRWFCLSRHWRTCLGDFDPTVWLLLQSMSQSLLLLFLQATC